jgi:short-subunit dehydrogenase
VGEGLGAALARRFATDYRVALIARSAEVIEKVAREIRTNGGVAATHELAVRPFREKF